MHRAAMQPENGECVANAAAAFETTLRPFINHFQSIMFTELLMLWFVQSINLFGALRFPVASCGCDRFDRYLAHEFHGWTKQPALIFQSIVCHLG